MSRRNSKSRLTRSARWALVILSMGASAAQVPDLSGTWRLDVGKSSWGRKAKPESVLVRVEHSEPHIRYSGTSTDPNGEERIFNFDGVVDGRERPANSAFGPAKVVLKRISPFSITSILQTNDGQYRETATTTISRDGQRLTRRLRERGPDRNASWTEVYARQ
jgi:hypothetical protein